MTFVKGDFLHISVSIGKNSNPNNGSIELYECTDIYQHPDGSGIMIYKFEHRGPKNNPNVPNLISLGVDIYGNIVWDRGVDSMSDTESIDISIAVESKIANTENN